MNGFAIIPLEIPTKTNTEVFLSGSRPSVAAEKKPKNRSPPVSVRMASMWGYPYRFDRHIDEYKRFGQKKRGDRAFRSPLYEVYFRNDYCCMSLNRIGAVKYTATLLPFCLPGIHLGMDLMTLIASSSKARSTGESTSTS